ncbi:hypothetical protein [Streptomyces sp. SID12501]|uniref:hypothetical protein n=1 Tax=Streptomyces sp. SID12501 TaxID=2706042 RepID=UPI0031BA77BB
MGDLTAAEAHLLQAPETYGLDRRRTRAIVLADLGHVQRKRGNTAEALVTWHEFRDCAEVVQSVRINHRISNVRARLPRLPDNPEGQSPSLAERLALQARRHRGNSQIPAAQGTKVSIAERRRPISLLFLPACAREAPGEPALFVHRTRPVCGANSSTVEGAGSAFRPRSLWSRARLGKGRCIAQASPILTCGGSQHV